MINWVFGMLRATISKASSIGSSRLYVPHFPKAKIRCSGFPRRANAGYSGLPDRIP
jgi:hypothetical protein